MRASERAVADDYRATALRRKPKGMGTVRQIKRGIIHCAATRPNWMQGAHVADKVSAIRHWHTSRGWRDIGYHWIIDRDGTVAPGRPETMQGAHVKGHNEDSVAVCLLGGHGSSENDAFRDNYTPEQESALRTMIAEWRAKYHGITIHGHNEFAAKACPGFNVRRWLDRKPPRTSPAQSTTLQASGGAAVATVAGAGSAVGQLDGTAQIVLIVAAVAVLAALAWIARERIKRWARGDR